jgi:glycosyltransferase involved in cell wall biosynthesis
VAPDGLPSICFVAPKVYPVLSGRPDVGGFGGAEVQQSLIARALARRGFRMSCITLDHGQPDGEVFDGVRVFKAYRSDAGMSGLRFFHPRWTGLWRAMKRANADVYYQRAAGVETGQVAMWCKLRGRPFVYAMASDLNLDPSLPTLPSWRERSLYRYGLRRAARVVCQTANQMGRCAAFGSGPTTVIGSGGLDSHAGGEFTRAFRTEGRPHVLWVGRFARAKRFEWLVDLAMISPEWVFDVVGDHSGTNEYVRGLVQRAKKVDNIILHGEVAHAEIGSYYQEADVLVCTSPAEGFPNTFLEAWARGTPTVSTVDPDGVIARNVLGAVASDPRGLHEAIARVVSSEATWSARSRNARSFFVAHHSIDAAADAYADLFIDLARSAAGVQS